MSEITQLSKSDLSAMEADLTTQYTNIKNRELSLDMTRGKPSNAQLTLSNELLMLPGTDNFSASDGTDCRNYGGVDGLDASKQLFGDLLGVDPQQVIVGGNASLTMMFDALVRACLFGVPGGNGPWNTQNNGGGLKFLCPTPGYDRHFLITQHLGLELIAVAMTDDGPDMGEVEALVKSDADIKGIWCVPKYSNPTGVVYSDETVSRLANMTTAATDFRIMWDNAYAEHCFTASAHTLLNIYNACVAAGNEDRVLLFASTSKMTFAGSGLTAMAASPANVKDALKHIGVQTIGPDKINQLRHLKLIPSMCVLREHMQKHAAILKPKFDKVQEVLHRELDNTGAAQWTNPQGGYFVSLDTHNGCAAAVIDLAAQVGVKFTRAGAPFPYGKDPNDRNIRIAPSFPPINDIELAMEVLAICLKLTIARKRLAELDKVN